LGLTQWIDNFRGGAEMFNSLFNVESSLFDEFRRMEQEMDEFFGRGSSGWVDIHGDVKPGNLLLEEDDRFDEPRIRVVDFGIARVVEGQDTTSRITRFDRGAPGQPRRRESARRWRSAADFIRS
jgi:hypothetical protein